MPSTSKSGPGPSFTYELGRTNAPASNAQVATALTERRVRRRSWLRNPRLRRRAENSPEAFAEDFSDSDGEVGLVIASRLPDERPHQHTLSRSIPRPGLNRGEDSLVSPQLIKAYPRCQHGKFTAKIGRLDSERAGCAHLRIRKGFRCLITTTAMPPTSVTPSKNS